MPGVRVTLASTHEGPVGPQMGSGCSVQRGKGSKALTSSRPRSAAAQGGFWKPWADRLRAPLRSGIGARLAEKLLGGLKTMIQHSPCQHGRHLGPRPPRSAGTGLHPGHGLTRAVPLWPGSSQGASGKDSPQVSRHQNFQFHVPEDVALAGKDIPSLASLSGPGTEYLGQEVARSSASCGDGTGAGGSLGACSHSRGQLLSSRWGTVSENYLKNK